MNAIWRVASRVHDAVRRKLWAIQGKLLLAPVLLKGENCRVEGGGIILDPGKLTLGDHVFIGRNVFMRCRGGLAIGSYTHISRNVTIHTVNHDISGDLLPYTKNEVCKPVSIGDFVWIGMNVSIVPGVRIGDGAVIGMGTVVSKDVAPGEIVVGAPQRVVSRRDADKTRMLVEQKKFLTLGKRV